MIDEDDLDEGEYYATHWCMSCACDTLQICHDSGHERDSSMDRRRCVKCGKVAFGLAGFKEYR